MRDGSLNGNALRDRCIRANLDGVFARGDIQPWFFRLFRPAPEKTPGAQIATNCQFASGHFRALSPGMNPTSKIAVTLFGRPLKSSG